MGPPRLAAEMMADTQTANSPEIMSGGPPQGTAMPELKSRDRKGMRRVS